MLVGHIHEDATRKLLSGVQALLIVDMHERVL